MQQRHLDRQQYFNEQAYTTEHYVVPLINQVRPINQELSVLEIGCGEGGNLKPFVDMGCKQIVGIDLSEGKIDNARHFFEQHPHRNRLKFQVADIYDVIEELGQFDLIITRDVLEHIHDQDRFMQEVRKLLKPNGKFFLGFPPWHNPFGGHQQMCKHKWLSKIPYFHLLPRGIYRRVLKTFGEKEKKIENLLEIRDTRIGIQRFERLLKKHHYLTDYRRFYLINPNYKIKFNLKPKEQTKLIASLPYFRDFVTTTNYYIVSRND